MLIINILCPLPQIYKTIKTKDVQDLNSWSSLLAILGDSLYLGSILFKPENKLTRVYLYTMLPWVMQAASTILQESLILLLILLFKNEREECPQLYYAFENEETVEIPRAILRKEQIGNTNTR